MSKTKKVTIRVHGWAKHIACPKCLMQEQSDESPYEPFHLCHIEDTDLLLLTCKVCGFNWLMETADAK